MKTAKFGGSSLADSAQFKKVKQIVMADKDRRLVVPSAPGKRDYTGLKVTDMLYSCQALAAAGKPFSAEYDRIVERYVDIAFELGLKIDILSYLEEIRGNIAGGASADYAASRGEYLCGLLLSDYLGFEFIDPATFIVFDERGVFDAMRTQTLAQARLRQVERAVIPGFYGAGPSGSIKTFARGGSDISGAIVARGSDSEIYENWTDVSGFLMADPRIVHNPRTIRHVTYTELRELAYMGATVLHEDSIFPVRQASIPIHVKNTNDPDAQGTLILPESPAMEDNGAITGIAGRKGFTVVAIEKDKMNSMVGFAASVLNVIAEMDISFEHMPTGIDTLSVVFSDAQLEGKREMLLSRIMQRCEPDSLEVYDNMALIATVGRGMIRRVGTSAAMFSALAHENINIRMIDQGSSEINIIIGVESSDFDEAVRAIYGAFVK